LLDCIEVELIGKVPADGISMWRVFAHLAELNRAPDGAGASKDLVELLGGDFDTICEIYWKLLVEAVDDKIK
jgi:hypothetical protein